MPQSTTTVGGYLAARLADIGVGHYFTVPGDYNLILLDELLKCDRLQMVSCCNELNAGYAADGYCRATGGPSMAVVTYSVGGLSLLNAVAGAFAEDLPLIAVSGGPNTNSTAEYELLHHTLGQVDYDYQREIYSRVTANAVVIQNPADAPAQIDHALEAAITRRKPVYIEVACNIAAAEISTPHPRTFDRHLPSDSDSLSCAVETAAELLNAAEKPVLVAGVKMRPGDAEDAFAALAAASGYAVAAMPNSKSFFNEQHPSYMGIYWGPVGTPGCGEIVESADLCVFVGPLFTDYSTTGHAALIHRSKMIEVRQDCVLIADQTFSDVAMSDFLTALAERLNHNDKSLKAFKRIEEVRPAIASGDAADPLTTRQLFARIQRLLTSETAVIAETGDSWFNGMSLDLPAQGRFEIQMQYGSIGWSVGATLGYCMGAPARQVVTCVGDGSFQLTAQEISTMIRYGARPIVFLINNGGYTIETEIHDGPYNTINNWDYARLVDVFNGDKGKGWGCSAATEGELDAAIAQALDHDGLSLIEVHIDRDDCSRNLLEWGGHVAKNNGRPPRQR
ncbi:MAG: thiamine pyrophosphate-binding protein [Planctomycetota bacterium]